MKESVLRTFGRGLFFALPMIVCLYILVWFFRWVDSGARSLFLFIIPDAAYIPGMGILISCLGIYGIGLLMSDSARHRWLSKIEMPFQNVPIVKSIYSAIKDLTTYFSPSEGNKASRVVLVKFPGLEMEVFGFLTRESLEAMPEGMSKDDRVGVYIPMSYQIGGFTVFIPKQWVNEVDVSIEVAMKATLTAWLPGAETRR